MPKNDGYEVPVTIRHCNNTNARVLHQRARIYVAYLDETIKHIAHDLED